MVPQDDARRTIELKDYYLIQPVFKFWGRRFLGEGTNPVPEDFEYHSGTNPWRLGMEEMREMVKNL
jgi:UDP-N-acetylglucosamine 4,6-dehydratase